MPRSYRLVPRDEMTVGDWLIAFLLTSIPVLGLISLLIWSFDENTAPSRSTWAKAMLIWYLISFIIFIFLLILALGLRLG